MASVRVFEYVEELDAFLVTQKFEDLAEQLGLTEWSAVVWLGRLFTLDEDYGEHWFDNWDEREEREQKAEALGLIDRDLMVVVPGRFAGGSDGPCHSDEVRKAFWTNVLKRLELDYDFLFQLSREYNERVREHFPEDHISDLEERIVQIQEQLSR